MIAVLGSRFDEPLRNAIATWHTAVPLIMLTPDNLLTPGWSILTHRISAGTFVAQGRPLPVCDLHGVINLLPQVYDFELLSIRRSDRLYVAAELFAFLTWWLRALPCVVFNRPTPGCLNGPCWRSEQWGMAARRADLPVLPTRRDSIVPQAASPQPTIEERSTFVMLEEAHGTLFPNECRKLAALAGTDFLEVFFRHENGAWIFHRVNLLPHITRPNIKDALNRALNSEEMEINNGPAVGTP